MKLNVGCGKRPLAGYVNLDVVHLHGVDVVHDLQQPLPFQDGTFDEVRAEDVLEHVDSVVAVVQELGRVLVAGGTLWVRGPSCNHPDIGWADVTHKRLFAPRSFDGFDPETVDGRLYGHYHGTVKFRRVSVVERNKGFEFTLVKR